MPQSTAGTGHRLPIVDVAATYRSSRNHCDVRPPIEMLNLNGAPGKLLVRSANSWPALPAASDLRSIRGTNSAENSQP
jgi:hypothetical protein